MRKYFFPLIFSAIRREQDHCPLRPCSSNVLATPLTYISVLFLLFLFPFFSSYFFQLLRLFQFKSFFFHPPTHFLCHPPTTHKTSKTPPSTEPRMYQCPHCPSEPPYAGASGLWYHMKRHHGAVTRPYNKTKNGDGTSNNREKKEKKPRTPKGPKGTKVKKKPKKEKKEKKTKGATFSAQKKGGRSKFPSSPRYRHDPTLQQQQQKQQSPLENEEEEEEEENEEEEEEDMRTEDGGERIKLFSSAFCGNGLMRPSSMSINLSTLDALKSLNSSPVNTKKYRKVQSQKKQSMMQRPLPHRQGGRFAAPSGLSELNNTSFVTNGSSSLTTESSSSSSSSSSSNPLSFLSEVSLLLEAGNSKTKAIIKTRTTTTIETTTEVSMDDDEKEKAVLKIDLGPIQQSPEEAIAKVAQDLNLTVHHVRLLFFFQFLVCCARKLFFFVWFLFSSITDIVYCVCFLFCRTR